MAFDTRQIQTAVQGGPDSDEPVVCPTDAAELDAFREETRGAAFWCSALLGGCGGQLSTRRCVDRASHFFHLPDPEGLLPPCGRRTQGSGVGSGDHLYVKRATQKWFHRQGLVPNYHFVDHEEAPVGSVVDIHVNEHRLRVHMNKDVPIDWNALGAGELILGPGVQIDRDLLALLRYVNRIKFKTEGRTRVVEIGTEVAGEGTRWNIDLADCRVTPDGWLVTPEVERVWNAEGHDPGRVLTAYRKAAGEAQAVASRQVGELIRSLQAATGRGRTTTARRLCEQADLEISRCEGSALVQLTAAVEQARNWISEQEDYRRSLFVRLAKVQQNGASDQTRSLVARVERLLERGGPPSRAESETLAAAKRLITPPQPSPPRPRPATQPQPRLQPQPEPAPQPNRSRHHEREQRVALAEAKGIIGQLRGRGLSDNGRRDLITRLIALEETVGHRFSVRERRDVEKWTRKLPASQRNASSSAPPQEPSP